MIQTIDIHILPELKSDKDQIIKNCAFKLGVKTARVTGINVLKRSIDARKKPIQYFMRVEVFIDQEFELKSAPIVSIPSLANFEKTVHIIGMGPAGMFAAIECLKLGLRPILFERGKPVRERRRDLAKINREHIVNPESNYCFGEGGAGTYSDGKLYTRSKKRGDLNAVLNTLVHFGADPDILVNSHPHIGTNKLPKIIEDMRDDIIRKGGEIHFNSKLTDIHHDSGKLRSITINDEDEHQVHHLVLATGHSARDIYRLLSKKKILIEAKPFALGVRIEHPQEIIDQIQYKCPSRGEHLPPASYQIVQQAEGLGVYSFCMCPGGIIAPCATEQNEVVTNGWSPSKRDNPFANSGFVVEIKEAHLDTEQFGALAGMHFQKEIEKKAWIAGGSTQRVPAQRMIDFTNSKLSGSMPKTSYHPGVVSYDLNEIFPKFIHNALRGALQEVKKKMPKYFTNEAVLHAVESRTSSPVRIPRDKLSLQHPDIIGFYPCGEGAGYAGGIVSAAIDGMRCIQAIKASYA